MSAVCVLLGRVITQYKGEMAGVILLLCVINCLFYQWKNC